LVLACVDQLGAFFCADLNTYCVRRLLLLTMTTTKEIEEEVVILVARARIPAMT
jgi:hypothetical protein